MKILFVSPYPPARDGIANYASQVVADLRRAGATVDVFSPQPSAAVFNADLRTARGLARVARLSRDYDRTIVQFTPEPFFHGMEPARFARGWVGLAALFAVCRNIEVVAHETPYQDSGRLGPVRMRMWKALWRQAAKIVVHTETERRLMHEVFGVADERLGLLDHGASFSRRTSASRAEARRSLGIDDKVFVFLCAGFLQPHKGFDRAAGALGALDSKNVRLDVVGEVRVWTREHKAYLDLLREQASADERVHLHEGYVTDEEFDRWIVASDVVVLPYREIWSSGVAERAALYDRPVLVTDVGGLADQVEPPSRVVPDEAGLVAAMAEMAGVTASETMAPFDRSTEAASLQPQVEQRARALRRWYDPLRDDGNASDRLPKIRVEEEPLMLPKVPGGLDPKAVALRAVRRLTRWQLEPVVRYVNALREEVLPEVPAARRGNGVGEHPDTDGR